MAGTLELDARLERDLASRFARLNWQLRAVRLLRGVGVAVVAVALVIALALAVDLLFAPAAGWRVALLLGAVLTAAGTLLLAVVRPWLRPPSAAELAALVEHAHPELAERLTSTVELADASLPEHERGSPLMRDMLYKQTLQSIARLDFTGAVSSRRAVRGLLAGFTAILLLVLPALFASSSYALLWSRLLNPWGEQATAGNLLFEIEGGDRVVPSGEDVLITAQVRWRYRSAALPQNIRLHWEYASGGGDSRRMEFDRQSGRFSATLTNVFDSFDFHVASGRDHSQTFHVTVVPRPEIVSAVLRATPPAYTGRPVEQFDGVRGEMTVFERSRMSLDVTFSKPVKSAEWHWLEDFATEPLPAEEAALRWPAPAAPQRPPSLPLALSSDGRTATLEFEALAGGDFALRLDDHHGLSNSIEPLRRLIVTPDAPPELSLAGSGEPRKARPDDVVQVVAAAGDDIGLGALELHYEVVQGAKGVQSVENARLGVTELTHTFELKLDELQVEEGVIVTYRVRAADERPVPGPNEVWSEPRMISVDREASVPESIDLTRRQQELRDALAAIRKDVQANREEVADLHEEAAGNLRMQLEFERDDEIVPLAAGQQDLARRTEEFAGRLAESPLYANLTGDTQQVARQDIEPASRGLRSALDEPLSEKSETLRSNVEQLAEAGRKLDDIARRFDELAELEHDLLKLSRLARQADELAEQALALDERRQNPPAGDDPEELARWQAELERDRRALAHDQEQLARQLDELLEQRPEILDAARQHELDRLEELSRLLRELIEPQEMLADAMQEESRPAAADSAPPAEQNPQQGQDASQPAAPQNADPNASGQEASANAADGQPPDVPAGSPERQAQLAREATRLALDAARQTGAESQATREAAQFAREAAQAARQAAAGQLGQAGQTAEQAAETAAQAAEQLGLAPHGQDNPELHQRAQELARQQAEQAEALATAANSPSARQAAQQSGQQQLAQSAGEIAEQLDDVADRLGSQPLDSQQPAAQAAASQQATGEARQSMQQAAENVARGNSGQAAESARQAAEALRRAAGQTERAVEETSVPESDVPSEMAGQLTEAARSLAEARRHLAESQAAQDAAESRASAAASPSQNGQPQAGASGESPAGQNQSGEPSSSSPSSGDNQSGEPSGQSPSSQSANGSSPQSGSPSGQPSQSGQPSGAQAAPGSASSGSQGSPSQTGSAPGQSGQSGQSEPSGQSPSSLAQSAQSLRQAAQALSRIAGQCNCAGGAPGGQGSGMASASGAPSGPSGSQSSQGDGSGTTASFDPAQLDIELQAIFSQDWGQLPGHLRTEILQSARRQPNSDYARLIKLYFEEIARTQKDRESRPAANQ